MTVDKALEIINRVITQELSAYNESPDSKDASGNRIPHPLDYVDDNDKLFALDVSLKNVALKTVPMTLLESVNDSTATEFKRVSKDYFVRVPAYPQVGSNLDIDSGLAYAVVFYALGELYSGFSTYTQKGDAICNEYNNAYRKVITDILNGAQSSNVAYIRFSPDGTNWHDSYQDGDIYISFKKIDTDTWTPAIKFVGDDGQPCSDTNFVALQDTPASYTGAAGKIVAVKSTEDGVEFIDAPSGGGASTFTDLTDTPADYTGASGKKVTVKSTEDGVEFIDDKFITLKDTPTDYTNAGGKFVAVKADASGLEFVDAPSGGTPTNFGDSATYDDQASGSYVADTENYNSFWLYPQDNLTISFKSFDDSGTTVNGWFGSTYTFALVSVGSVAINFDTGVTIYGDTTVALGNDSANTNITLTLLDLYYDGVSFVVKNRTVINDYNP